MQHEIIEKMAKDITELKKSIIVLSNITSKLFELCNSNSRLIELLHEKIELKNESH